MNIEVQRYKFQKEQIRKDLLKYTRKALDMLPHLDKPDILDVGCGSGVPTMELARLTDGNIIALDIDQDSLDELAGKAEEAGVSDRVKTVNCSLIDMDFPAESFDIIWAEGSIAVIGFERGIREWKRFLKPGGFLVVHDARGNVNEKLAQITQCGYQLLGYFVLSLDTWQAEYFAPLQKLIDTTRFQYSGDQGIMEELARDQREIDMFGNNEELSSSVIFVMKKA